MLDRRDWKHPLFLGGLAIRLFLILLVVPSAANDWYVPFLDSSVTHFSLDPWGAYLAAGGTPLAFPYGYAMWLVFAPLCYLAKLAGVSVYYGYALTLLLVDASMLAVLGRFMKVSARTLLLLYWCSPIVLFATYWLGLNDLVPVAFLCFGLLCLGKRMPLMAGAWLGAAISAKLSMAAALPLMAFFIWRNRANRVMAKPLAQGFGLAALLLLLPFCLSSSALQMLQRNPEVQKIYELSIKLGGAGEIYFLGMAYVFMLYVVWRIGRFGVGLLFAALATTFFLLLLLTPAAPGWFVWVTPFLVYLQIQGGRRMVGLVAIFSAAYVAVAFLNAPLPHADLLPMELFVQLKDAIGSHVRNIMLTVLTSFGAVLCWRIWREAVLRNDPFGLSRRPVVLGVAGDSGAGKDTLVDSLTGLFGNHSVVSISGDDYHFWDRHKPMWQVMTHLNPQANDLEKFAMDVADLSARRSIIARHYDHGKGVKGRPYRLPANDFVMVSGLHALYLPALRDRYDVSIYLDIDERLRRYFKLRRDVTVRGHPREKVIAAIERRESDSLHFVRPQRDQADLVLSLQPIHPHLLNDLDPTRDVRTKLTVRGRRGGLETQLRRQLVGICGLHVDLDLATDERHVVMTIEGDVWAEDIALAARQLLSGIEEILDLVPRWEGGVVGLMQLFVLCHIYRMRVEKLAR